MGENICIGSNVLEPIGYTPFLFSHIVFSVGSYIEVIIERVPSN